ncbi:MAG: hypothetical protein D3925_02430, partial [Candidatus Electrothrix sp. AR5]|nr:hypothetical protein [Candidatus Electrothrix sp. AR5]
VDEEGFIYLYGAGGKIVSYADDGTKVNELNIDENRWGSRGPMHIVMKDLYVRGDGEGDVSIALVDEGKVLPLSEEEAESPVGYGIYGTSAKKYFAFLNNEEGQTGIDVENLEESMYRVVLPQENVISLRMIGEDQQENFYVATEVSVEGQTDIDVSVLQFDREGNYINTTEILEGDYNFWAIKNWTVDKKGNIYQMVPSGDAMTIRKVEGKKHD